MSSDFSSFLGHNSFNFGIDAVYINVVSIEKCYSRMYGYRNRRSVFANWIDNNVSTVVFVFDYLRHNRDINICSFEDVISNEQKINHIVCRRPQYHTIVHPLIAIIFALGISDEFSVFVISRIICMMNNENIDKYISLISTQYQSNLDWQSVVNTKNIEIQHIKHQIDLESRLHTRRQNDMSFCRRVLKCFTSCVARRDKHDHFDYTRFGTNHSKI
jgi:hypothetical protein